MGEYERKRKVKLLHVISCLQYTQQKLPKLSRPDNIKLASTMTFFLTLLKIFKDTEKGISKKITGKGGDISGLIWVIKC